VQVGGEIDARGLLGGLLAEQRHAVLSAGETRSMEDFASIGKLSAHGYNRRQSFGRLFIFPS
jgi:hypothetical protein